MKICCVDFAPVDDSLLNVATATGDRLDAASMTGGRG